MIRLYFLILILIVVISCKNATNKPITTNSIHVTDFRGKEIVFSKHPTRIICLIESGLSGLYMLRAEKSIIAISSNIYDKSVCREYTALDDRIQNKTLPTPGNWDFVSIEQVVALQPDLVIIWASQTEAIETIEGHGIAVYGVFLKSFADVYKEIADFGVLTNTSERADSIIQFTKNETDQLKAKINVTNKKSVYFMWAQGLLETAGTTSTVNELIELAGAKNSCTISQEHAVVNKEQLFDWNPDVFVMWNNAQQNPENIIQIEELKNLQAIHKKQVYELPSVFDCDLWTLKFPYAAKLVAKWCYPDIFKETDMNTEKQEMLVKLYGSKAKNM